MKFRVTVPPSSEPISLEEARDHLRVTLFGSPLAHPDDDLITRLISGARKHCEEYLRRALATQTIQAALDGFEDNVELPMFPIQGIDSITYTDTNGATQTLATSVYGLDEYTGTLYRKYNQSWPATRDEVNAVTITYTAGYTNGESPDTYPMEGDIKSAMLLIIGNLYEHRTQDVVNGSQLNFNSLPLGVYALLQPYRRGMGL